MARNSVTLIIIITVPVLHVCTTHISDIGKQRIPNRFIYIYICMNPSIQRMTQKSRQENTKQGQKQTKRQGHPKLTQEVSLCISLPNCLCPSLVGTLFQENYNMTCHRTPFPHRVYFFVCSSLDIHAGQGCVEEAHNVRPHLGLDVHHLNTHKHTHTQRAGRERSDGKDTERCVKTRKIIWYMSIHKQWPTLTYIKHTQTPIYIYTHTHHCAGQKCKAACYGPLDLSRTVKPGISYNHA